MELKDYQSESLEKLIAHFKNSAIGLLVMATGLGKTIIAAHWAKAVTRQSVTRGLVLCHEAEILGQDLSEFKQVLGESVSFGVFHGGEKNFNSVDWLFATFQTMLEWKAVFTPDEFDYIIVDESHHSQARTYLETITYFKPKKMLGMTATPDRMDEKNIREIFGVEVVDIPLAEAIAKGWLTHVEYRLIADNLNRFALNKLFLALVDNPGKKVSMKQLNETLFIDARDNEIAKIILSENKKTIIFCENINHCNNFAQFIPESYAYHTDRLAKDNVEAMKQFKDNDLQFLLAVNKLNEGVDIPNVELIVFLRATDSSTVFWQQLGRGLRKIPGKQKVIVMDFVANCERLTMVRDLAHQIGAFANTDLIKDSLHIKGSSFDFVFTRGDLDIYDVIDRCMRHRFISDVQLLATEYMSPPKNEKPDDQVRIGSNNKVYWKCSKDSCGHSWLASVNSRFRGAGCPSCTRQIATSSNNLSITHQQLAREYMPPPKNEKPVTLILSGSDKKVWWKHSNLDGCSYEWSASVKSRACGKNGCPSCAGRVVTELNNLTVTHPQLALEYMPPPMNDRHAYQVIGGTKIKYWWKCSKTGCGHEYQATGDSRGRGGTNCPACSGRVATAATNITVTHPYLALEYMEFPKNSLPVEKIVAGTGRRIWWKCFDAGCGHEYQATGDNRIRSGTNCPACYHKARGRMRAGISQNENHLEITYMRSY